MSPFGETLRLARVAKKITFEDAERVTRISRRYLEALEQENFGILPAPVYARGFLRSYAGYLGLDPSQLLPLFPVGEVGEPKMAPLPKVREPRMWSVRGLIPMAAVGLLVLLVVALYSVGREDSSGSLVRQESGFGVSAESRGLSGQSLGLVLALPDLAGVSLAKAVDEIEETGASYVVIGVSRSDTLAGVVVDHLPSPGTLVGPGDLVMLVVSR